jgi:phosphatidylserine/phosphatidylglycerophosphate/cardiolipin synthase-like enzyme
MMRHLLLLLASCLFLLLPSGCAMEPEEQDLIDSRSQRVDTYLNYAGTRASNFFNSTSDDMIVQLVDRAEYSVDAAAMGFSRRPVVDALVRAYLRGVRVRFVGDARHMHGDVYGYEVLKNLNVPMQVGNQPHIMHNKFFIIDGFIVYAGTGNITGTDIDRNNNSWYVIQSPDVAADFTAEFEQMFSGRFGAAKVPNNNGNSYQVGDTRVEVYFSPHEDALGRLLQAIREAEESIEFTIFAFTKDQVGSELVTKHLEFQQYNVCCDPARTRTPEQLAVCEERVECAPVFRERYVRGVIDRSQLHSNGPYHELYRLVTYGIPLRLDGNDNSVLPGDYQAGGGRLHSKTMVIDADLPTALVLSGSFNWSTSATQSNDETMLVLHNQRIAQEMAWFFQYLWDTGRNLGNDYVGDGRVLPGSVVFNEIHWDGHNGGTEPGGDATSNDEFIELLNTTPFTIDLSLWAIASDEDFVAGLFPGTVIGPYERFLLLDHNTTPYIDSLPQERGGAFQNPDFVMNMANDARFLRLNLHNARMRLRLVDPRGNVVDIAGDGGPPFWGGRESTDAGGIITRSMERIHVVCPEGDTTCVPIADGTLPSSWQAFQGTSGGSNVREGFRGIVFASPGENNSGGEVFPDENPSWRSEAGVRDP